MEQRFLQSVTIQQRLSQESDSEIGGNWLMLREASLRTKQNTRLTLCMVLEAPKECIFQNHSNNYLPKKWTCYVLFLDMHLSYK